MDNLRWLVWHEDDSEENAKEIIATEADIAAEQFAYEMDIQGAMEWFAQASSLQLVAVKRKSGQTPPQWFYIHVEYEPQYRAEPRDGCND